MKKYRIGSIFLLALLALMAWFLVVSERSGSRFPYHFGLDLVGGTELTYRADVSQIEPSDIKGAMETLRDVIERRINIFGVSEPLIQVEEAGILSGNTDHRLLVELPGVTDIEEAVALIGATPVLEFRLERPGAREHIAEEISASTTIDELFSETGLTGRLLKRASLQFEQTTGQPLVALEFNDEGRELFARITAENVGKVLAVVLDGKIIQVPVIQSSIPDGVAQISGSFTAQEAKEVVRQLNYGALPVPIELIGTQTIGATLGDAALAAGVRAGLWGLGALVLFMVLWYRLPGFLASFALLLYSALSLALFKLIPVTLTAAGVAGFVLSIGMAIDANVLIFERMKEELKRGAKLHDAIHEGFARAWLSIRDSNISSIITSIVLFWLGTSAVKGFALTLGLGVVVSMFSAITVSRTFLFAVAPEKEGKLTHFLFGSGFSKK